MANTSIKGKEDRARVGTAKGPGGIVCLWSLVPAPKGKLYRVDIKTPGGLTFFLLRIPCTVLDNGKVKLGALDYTDQESEALYLPLDLASSIVDLMTQRGVLV